MKKLLLSLLVLLWVQPAWAGYTHIQTSKQAPTEGSSTITASLTETFASTPTVGNLAIVEVAIKHHGDTSTVSISSVQDNQATHNTWSLAQSWRVATGFGIAEQAEVFVYYSVLSNASGTFSVTVTTSAAADGLSMGISEWSGNVSTTPLDTSSGSDTGISGSTQCSPALTPSQSGDLIFSVVGDDLGTGTETFTVPSGYSERTRTVNSTSHVVHDSASFVKLDTTAELPQWNFPATRNAACVLVAFKGVAAPPPPPATTIFIQGSTRVRLRVKGTTL